MFEINQHIIGDWTLPALINGDYTGMDDGDEALLTDWVDWATDDWEDANGVRWVFDHFGDYEECGFTECEVTSLYANCVKLDLVFRPYSSK